PARRPSQKNSARSSAAPRRWATDPGHTRFHPIHAPARRDVNTFGRAGFVLRQIVSIFSMMHRARPWPFLAALLVSLVACTPAPVSPALQAHLDAHEKIRPKYFYQSIIRVANADR